MNDDQQGQLIRSDDQKDELIAHLRKQADFAIARMGEVLQDNQCIRWHAGSDWLLIQCWHAINDEIDNYKAQARVSEMIEEHLGFNGQFCDGCGKACLAGADGEDLFLQPNWCQECEDKKQRTLLATLGVTY